MPKANLTASFVAQVKPPAKGRTYWMDETLPGLALCVSKTGSKVWYFVGRGEGGRPTREKLAKYPKITAAQARTLCVQVHADLLSGTPPTTRVARQAMTVGEVWAWHLTHILKANNRTWRADERTYTREVKQWENLSIRALSRTMVIEHRTKLLANGPGAVNLFLTVLRGIFKTAMSEGWIDRNPVEQIKKCRIPKRDRFIDENEIATFFTALAKLKQDRQDYFMVVLFTGARKSAVCAMAWADIHFTRATWTIPSTDSKNKDPIYLPLSSFVMEILIRRKAVSQSRWVFPGRNIDSHYADPKRQWAKLLKGSGLSNLRIHDLRRTLGSWQAIAGVSLKTIMDSLGQKSASAALIYARLNDKTVRESVQSTADSITLVVESKKLENSSK